jgi:isocitrate dehydrogenase
MTGERIKKTAGQLSVPDLPVIPFIRGDGTGPDIWAASVRVFDAAVEKAYKGKAHKCIITDLMPRTSYRFRVAPILTQEDGSND